MKLNPLYMPVRELSKHIREGKISPVELAEFFLGRLEKLGPDLNAVVTVTRERALSQARKAEKEIEAGLYRGPLHGIPYGAKDLLATKGIPTTWGAAPFRNQVFDRDATVIEKLNEAGAILCAKLAMIELAGGMGYKQPFASFTGPPKNPWNAGTWTGGSSSGSGGLCLRRPRPLRVRLRDLGEHTQSSEQLRRSRLTAHIWASEPSWCYGSLLDS